MKKIITLFFIILCFFISKNFVLAENLPAQTDKIDINSASLSELDQLIGIGPTYAQRIIENRPYLSLDDLLKIKGIGEATLQKIKDQGLACVNCVITPIPTQTPPPPMIAPIIYPSGIIFNEILPSPEGADEDNEFIELYNTNNFDVNLSGWKIKDTEGTSTTFIIPSETKITANGFFVFKRPQTKISLNNSGDTINLILPNNKIIDSVTFPKALLNQSYNKTNSSWSWSVNLTPNKQNIILQATLNDSENSLLKTNNSGNSIVKQDKLLSSLIDSEIENKIKKDNPWFLFIIVLTISIILSITILVLKIKFNF